MIPSYVTSVFGNFMSVPTRLGIKTPQIMLILKQFMHAPSEYCSNYIDEFKPLLFLQELCNCTISHNRHSREDHATDAAIMELIKIQMVNQWGYK